MFSAKSLIGTPQRLGGSRVDFTPIGKAQRTKNALFHEDAADSTFNQTFDGTGDDFLDATITGVYENPVRRSRPASSVRTARFGSEIVHNGASSVREQQLESQKLEAENYNLKVKLATLSRFLDQTPEEQRKQIEENIDLKLQIADAASEIRHLHVQIDNLKYLNEKENGNAEVVHQMEGEIARLKLEMKSLRLENAEKEHESARLIQELQDENATKTHELERLHANATSARLGFEEAQNKLESNESIRAEIEHRFRDEITTLERQLSVAIEENSTLTREIGDLKLRLEAEKSNPANEEDLRQIRQLRQNLETSTSTIGKLEDEVFRWKEKFNALRNENSEGNTKTMEQLLEAEDRNRRLQDQIDEIQRDLRKSEADYSEMSRKYAEVELSASEIERLKRGKAEIEQELHENMDTVSKLRRQNMQMQRELDMRFSGADEEAVRLKSRIEHLENELKERDVLESNMRRKLAESANSQSSSAVSAFDSKFFQEQYEEAKQGERKWRSALDEARDENQRQVSNLKKDVADLKDQLTFYEEEYASLERNAQRESQDLLQRCKTLEFQLESKTEEIERLKNLNNNRSMYNQNTKLDDFDSFSYNQLERETQTLRAQLAEAKIQTQSLQRQLDETRMQRMPGGFETPLTPPRNSHDGYEKNRLLANLDEKDMRIRELESKSSRLESAIRDKESSIEAMEAKIRDINRAKRLDAINDDEELVDLMKLKASSSAKIRSLHMEIESLKEEHEREIEMYKRLKGSSTNDAIVKLLEKQLEDAQRKQDEILIKSKKEAADKADLLSKIEEFETERKANLETIVKLRKSKSSEVQEKEDLERDNDILKSKLKEHRRDCVLLANKVKQLRKEAYSGNSEVEQLQHQIKALTVSERDVGNQSNLATKEILYYKARLYDEKLKINDLQMINQFVMSSIKNSNSMLKDDLAQLSKFGIYPDYQARKFDRLKGENRLTFLALAKFVLALVRLKNRTEYSRNRTLWLEGLKEEVQRGV